MVWLRGVVGAEVIFTTALAFAAFGIPPNSLYHSFRLLRAVPVPA
jgi:hypothetical protein